ncbi:MAG: GreA/GreB family elongation factor, partial [Candidatus Eremiobacteraeota bacterium]|nr:GreA/GreB family elongation factor [Candidatus Eremiobacteraeota bacterium]
MSRGFVKDDDDRPERPPSRPVSDRPNYVTAHGLEMLQAALAEARANADQRNVHYYDERIGSAEVVDPNAGEPGVVAFGRTVIGHDEATGAAFRFRIVGEDEADPAHGTVSWISPYAEALLGHRTGDRVIVQRPAGPAAVVIEAVEI